jgi:hypothetical protein
MRYSLREKNKDAKAFARLRVSCYVLRQELPGNEAAEFSVLGLVDHTHPAAAELLDNAVVRDGLPDHAVGPC